MNRAPGANAFPAPDKSDPSMVVYVPGRPGNPAGGTYWSVKYVVLNELNVTTLYFAKDPTQDELDWFKQALSDLARQQSFYTGEADWQGQADLGFAQYQQWVLKQREP